MTDKDGPVTAAEYCGRIAGILAGIPMGMSCAYAALPELTAVTARTTEEQIEAINNGMLILIHDGIQAKIARGVNSLTTIPATGKADWSKIKLVIRDTMNDFIWKRTKRRPMILPIIMEV